MSSCIETPASSILIEICLKLSLYQNVLFHLREKIQKSFQQRSAWVKKREILCHVSTAFIALHRLFRGLIFNAVYWCHCVISSGNLCNASSKIQSWVRHQLNILSPAAQAMYLELLWIICNAIYTNCCIGRRGYVTNFDEKKSPFYVFGCWCKLYFALRITLIHYLKKKP